MNLGRHVAEDDAARAYDKAAICARGKEVAKLNFSIEDYSDELEHLQSTTVAELAPLLRCCFFSSLMPFLHYSGTCSFVHGMAEHHHKLLFCAPLTVQSVVPVLTPLTNKTNRIRYCGL